MRMPPGWDLPGSKAGFTGTRQNITSFQRDALMSFLAEVKPVEVHYGDCTGADYEMFLLCKSLGVWTVSHPPDVDTFRMWTAGDRIMPVKPYIIRNHDIVYETDYLVACPSREGEVLRSGTWATVRYARKLGRTVTLIFPGGRVDIERHGR